MSGSPEDAEDTVAKLAVGVTGRTMLAAAAVLVLIPPFSEGGPIGVVKDWGRTLPPALTLIGVAYLGLVAHAVRRARAIGFYRPDDATMTRFERFALGVIAVCTILTFLSLAKLNIRALTTILDSTLLAALVTRLVLLALLRVAPSLTSVLQMAFVGGLLAVHWV